MSSIQIDRTDGLSSSTAIKGPCHAATTVNIALYALQTIDGVVLSEGDRVLVKNQTAGYECGIYVVDTGQWRRAKDFNRNNDVRLGTQVLVTKGTTYERSLWCVTSLDPIIIGTDAVVFEETIASASEMEALEASAAASAAAADASAALASGYADFIRNNWDPVGPFMGTGVAANYPLIIDPGSANNMFPVVGGLVQMVTDGAYSLVYVGGNPFININVPAGVIFEVRIGNKIDVNTPTDGSVSTAKIQANAVTYAKMQDVSATARLLGRVTAGAGDPEEVTPAQLRDTFFPAGSVVDSAYAENVTWATLSTLIPTDDTIPQITEGTEILTATITPKKTTNKIRVHVELWGSTAAASTMIAALFVNAAANAVAVVEVTSDPDRKCMSLSYQYTPGATSSQTIAVRAGPSAATTMVINGTSAARKFGGASRCTLEITEIAG
jgi:hypothetical protein